MPQKRNPDAAELVRGKSGRVCGALTSLLMMVKGLPLAYNRDLQEDRAALFDAVATTHDSVAIMAGVWHGLAVDRDRFERTLKGDPSLATELADYLASQGVPFREAHEAIGRLVRWCDEAGRSLDQLDGDTAGRFHPGLTQAPLATLLDPRAATARRTSLGGTAWPEVTRQAALLRHEISPT
jgi:argininosuccinate lyase